MGKTFGLKYVLTILPITLSLVYPQVWDTKAAAFIQSRLDDASFGSVQHFA